MSRIGIALPLLGVLCSCIAAHGQASVNEKLETAFYWVDTNKGNDSNPGTQSEPFQTIGKGISTAISNQRAGIGSRVTVNPGTYRESLSITPGGSSTSLPITIEAATNGTVYVSGAVQSTGWTTYPQNSSIYTNSWPYNFGTCATNPVGPAQQEIVLRQEMIIVNGTPLTQVLSQVQMQPGTFYVDTTSSVAYIWPPSGTDISTADVEVATNPSLLYIWGMSSVVIRGLTFEYANTCRTDNPAANIAGASNNILLDHDSFDWNNATALGFSNPVTNFTVQYSTANHNGRSGMGDYETQNALWLNDEASYNNWRGAQGSYYYWGSSGDYFYSEHGGTVTNMTTKFNETNGMHWDTDNENIAVNSSYSSQNLLNGFFVEKNEGPVTFSSSYACGNGAAGTNQQAQDGGFAVRNSENVTFKGGAAYGNGNTQIMIEGVAGGIPITNWQTGQQYNLITQNYVETGNTIESTSTAQQVFTDAYLSGADWTTFQTTFTSSSNDWWNAAANTPYTVPVPNGGTQVDFSGWQTTTGQDLVGSSFSTPSKNPASVCMFQPDQPDYWLLVNQYTQNVAADGTASFVMTTQPLGSFSGNLNLTLDGISEVPGLSGSLSAKTVAVGGTSTLSMSASTKTAPGTYPITVIANQGNTTHTSTFSLVVPQTQIRLSTANLNFGTVQKNTTSTPINVTMTNFGQTSVSISSITASKAFGVTNTCGSSLGAGKTCTLSVTFTPPYEQTFLGTITVRDSDGASPQIINVTGIGGGAPRTSFSPHSLSFGEEKVGSSSSPKTVTMTNTGDAALTGTKVSIIGTDPGDYSQTNTCGTSVPAGGTCTITVTFKPKESGKRTATVQTTDNAPTSPQSFSLTGTGQ
jgi:Abnormal spindle-like microcephaly-assoc'd, ASPM-SPD-2-Hydin